MVVDALRLLVADEAVEAKLDNRKNAFDLRQASLLLLGNDLGSRVGSWQHLAGASSSTSALMASVTGHNQAFLLRERLVAAGKIHHDHVFVHASGEPLRDLQVAAIRWRKTLLSLKVRYRRPYTARHSS